jgi:MoxR-like ATPase
VTSGIERLDVGAYKLNSGMKYVDVFKLEPMFEQMFGQPVPPNLILMGPKGVAKSLSLQTFAAKKGIPVIVSEGSEDVRRSHLIGMFILRGDQSPFVLGDLTSAIEIANEAGAAILILEEVNALSPQVQKLLNPLCDFRRRISVPECGKVFELKPGAKLWVVGTMNTAVYGGVYALNEDLKSRFRILPLGYPEPAAEKSIVDALMPKADPKLVKNVLTLAHETRQNSLNYALSTRDVIQIVEDAILLGITQALKLASGKYEDSDRQVFGARAASVFGKAGTI